MTDPYNLQRFLDAQNPKFEKVCAELRRGKKTGHWMWYIFPQLKGLGESTTSQIYGISSLDEAKAFLNHPTLGLRIRKCSRLVNLVKGRPISKIFNDPDDLKFRSSMTLFAQATSENEVFLEALHKYFGGEFDQLTLDRLKSQ